MKAEWDIRRDGMGYGKGLAPWQLVHVNCKNDEFMNRIFWPGDNRDRCCACGTGAPYDMRVMYKLFCMGTAQGLITY
jgi:hypothetical protein